MKPIAIVIAMAACSTPASTTTPTLPGDRVATLRIDSVLGGRRMVWLERDGNTPLVVDYPLPQWTSFKDQRVVVTGYCYKSTRPGAQFTVETLRVVAPTGPFIGFGPTHLIEGTFVSASMFDAADGTAYQLVGGMMFPPPVGQRMFVVGRLFEPSPSNAGRYLWVVALHDTMHEVPELKRIECPR